MKKLVSLCGSLILFSLIGGVHAADESPETIAGAKTIDVAEAKSLFDNGTAFIDVRSDKDWAAGRIPDAVHMELKKVFSAETLGNEVKKDEAVVFYCNGTSCMRSSKASETAVEWGYSNVYYFRLGYPAWKAAGYPTE
jgi:rhodanese-related sulfurtransferase